MPEENKTETAAPTKQGEEKVGGFGFTVGGYFVGVATGKNANGVGLKLPGSLIGVAILKKEGGENKSK